MGRWPPDARDRLATAALELYGERGFEATTVADIAERAGVTERTFFRHFADKREVLFDGVSGLVDAVVGAIASTPLDVSPFDTVRLAMQRAAALIEDGRAHAGRRAAVIAANPGLRERELLKLAALARAAAEAMRGRGIQEPLASLAAESGVSVFRIAFDQWLADPSSRGFSATIEDVFALLVVEARVQDRARSSPDPAAATGRERDRPPARHVSASAG